MQEPNIIRVAAAMVMRTNSDTLLVRKRGTSAFMQPGGKIEAGETPANALIRELEEEIGLVADVVDLKPMGRLEAPAANEVGHVVIAEVYQVDVGDCTIHISGEIEEAVWVKVGAAGDIAMAPLTQHHIFPAYLRLAVPAEGHQ